MVSSLHEIILTSSPDGPITAYKASNGAIIMQFTGSRSPCRGLTMVGRELIAVSHVFSDTGAGSIHIYNWYTPTVFRMFNVPEPVAPLSATSDGAFLFAGGLSGSIHSFSLASGDVIKSFVAHSKPVSCLQLSDDGSLVISGSDDGTIVVIPTFRLVEASSSSSAGDDPKDLILHQWKAHSDSVTAFSFGIGLCGTAMVSCSLDCTCKFWTLSDESPLRTVAFPSAILAVVMESTVSGIFYAAGANALVCKGSMEIRSGQTSELIPWSKTHCASIVSLALVNSGRNLVSAAEDGRVSMWEVETGEVTKVLGGGIGSISDMVVAKNITECAVRKRIDTDKVANVFTGSSEHCDELMIKVQKQITEIGDVTDLVVEDKKRAIEMLESTIGLYERLLKLMLREVMKAISSNNDNEEECGEEKNGEGNEGEEE